MRLLREIQCGNLKVDLLEFEVAVDIELLVMVQIYNVVCKVLQGILNLQAFIIVTV